ncbi:MAG: hypothetical protein IT406_00150 [Candidatus Yanofskybacteria bacterium]|nr:hypothetical protein [Candidatus Yanofskybacteria bacterium]
MLTGPQVPQLSQAPLPEFRMAWGGEALRLEISPLSLVVLTLLAGIFVAAMSVVLVYHWRRFPFEHETFRRAERVYLFGVVVFLAMAVAGIFLL